LLRVLLIDDEPPARAFLREVLAELPGVVVAGEAGTMDEARAQLARPAYDLVLLDVQLRGGTGFDLVPLVRPGARVVFATSHDRFAVRAFTVNALDYLLKPIDPARLAEAIARAAPPAAPGALPAPALAAGDLVHIKTGAGTTRFIPLAAIATVTACDNYTEVTLADGARHLVRRTLASWAEALPPAAFVRVHRHALVHLVHLRRIDRVTDETTHLTVAGVSDPVRASFRYLPELRARLAALQPG
jgi:two-component system LytT family response regulator